MQNEGYTIKRIASVVGGQVIGNQTDTIVVKEILFDSRLLIDAENTLFFALNGGRNDGHKYINDLLKLKKCLNFEAEVISFSMQLGASKEQSISWMKEIKGEISKVSNIKLVEKAYLKVKKEHPKLTKREFCKAYDRNSELLISYYLQDIKEKYPNIYTKYFDKSLSDILK